MLNGFFDDYLTYCKTLALAANSTKELTRYIKQLDAYLVNDGPTKLAQLQYKHLVNFAISNQAAPTTVKARIWAMKKFFSFLHLHDYIKDNIAINLSPPKIPKKELKTVITLTGFGILSLSCLWPLPVCENLQPLPSM
jgi:site-specific recombinase XerD